MIKISLKGLVLFMTADDSKKRRILRNFKYKDEGAVVKTYYKEAANAIKTFYNQKLGVHYLLDKATELRLRARTESGQTKSRLTHNAIAISMFAQYFSDLDLSVSSMPEKPELVVDSVRVSAYPDLYGKVDGEETIFKFDYVKDEPTKDMIKIITQTLFEACTTNHFQLKSKNVNYVDVRRGAIHKGARAGSRMRRRIEDACKNIAAIWDKI